MAQLSDGCWAIANSARINLKYMMLQPQAPSLGLLRVCTDQLAATSIAEIQRWGRTVVAYSLARGIALASQGRRQVSQAGLQCRHHNL